MHDATLLVANAPQAAQGLPVCEQLLTGNGRILLDSQTLSASGLQADSTVHVLLRLCGGKGGVGALLRGQGRDGKITDNFDACRASVGTEFVMLKQKRSLRNGSRIPKNESWRSWP